MHQFINLRLTRKNLDRFHIRSKIHAFVLEQIIQLSGTVLDVGCGQMPYKSLITNQLDVEKYIGLDIETAIDYGGAQPDIVWQNGSIPLENETIDSAFATEVLEHCPNPDHILTEICRVMKPNGFFFATVPFLWPLHEVAHDAFRYTPFTLERMLRNAGFSKIEITAHGGWHAAMAQMLGLYIKRGIRNKLIAFLMSIICYPIIYVLLKIDKPSSDFKESSMFTGFRIVAHK
jgi:SAM-dependent methyltransferase